MHPPAASTAALFMRYYCRRALVHHVRTNIICNANWCRRGRGGGVCVSLFSPTHAAAAALATSLLITSRVIYERRWGHISTRRGAFKVAANMTRPKLLSLLQPAAYTNRQHGRQCRPNRTMGLKLFRDCCDIRQWRALIATMASYSNWNQDKSTCSYRYDLWGRKLFFDCFLFITFEVMKIFK